MNILYNTLLNQEVPKTFLGGQKYLVPPLIERPAIVITVSVYNSYFVW